MCDCSMGKILRVDGFNTCTLCGSLKSSQEYLNGIENYVEPLQMCVYQRKKRFEEMLSKLVFPHPDRKDELVLEALHRNNKQFDTTAELVVFLKQTKIKDKRYQSVHAFSRFFVKQYIHLQPLSMLTFKRCSKMFEHIEFKFVKTTKNVPFFNYNWLMKKILHAFNIFCYDPFLKNIKCKIRNAYYENLYKQLSS